MKDFILFMYNDATNDAIANNSDRWGEYFSGLRSSGHFDGGSSIGSGLRLRKGGADRAATTDLEGFIRFRARDIDDARKFLAGNPVYEGGATVEIRELPIDG
jgi:hypothetical protein